MSDKPELTITPEVVQEVLPTDTVAEMLSKTLDSETYSAWHNYHYGSGYYVELPNYLNGLAETGETGEVRAVIERCFAGEGIPDSDWQTMIRYREKPYQLGMKDSD